MYHIKCARRREKRKYTTNLNFKTRKINKVFKTKKNLIQKELQKIKILN